MQLSVIIVSYNEAEYLSECFDSILDMNIDFEYEVIVGDDGSNDVSLEIIKEYSHKFKNFSYFINDREPGLTKENIIPSVRVSATILRAMKLAKGKYLNILSGDDYFISTDYYKNAVYFLEENKRYSAYVTNFYWVYPNGEKKKNCFSVYSEFCFWTQYVHLSCYVFKNLLGTNCLIDNLFDDCGMQFSIALNGKLKYSEEIVFSYRQREKSIMHEYRREELNIIEMLLFQCCLNKSLPSLSKISSYIKLRKLTYRHFADAFNALYKDLGKIDALAYRKYAEFSKNKKNDIVGALLFPEKNESQKILKRINKKVNRRNFFMKAFFRKLRDKLFKNAIRSIIHDEMTQQFVAVSQLSEKLATLEKQQFIFQVQEHYKKVRERIIERVSKGEKLRFVSYVVYDTTFGAHGICELMLKEPQKYDVKFVICPDTYRDKDFSQYRKTKAFFAERYGADAVLDGYDEATGEFVDWSDACDVVYMANKYDVLVNKVHGIQYLCTQDVLPIHLNYGFRISTWSLKHDEEQRLSCFYYKYFLNSVFEKRDVQECRITPLCDNIVVSGYPKMDGLADIKIESAKANGKKKILLAPHHTVKGMGGDLQLSNFLEYSDFILRLPDLYPDVDFVFRPHPLLFTNLKMHGIWTEEQVADYLATLGKKGVVYSTEGDYFHLFAECDAIIHDCGSFIEEWLFTGKPACYVMETEEEIKKQLNTDGIICLKYHTKANSEEKIKAFIEKIINNDYQVKVEDEIKNKIMVNYPNASKFILNNLI